jgi:predicted ATP-grasp superfamily ATP-dependent carboligase
MEIKNIETLKKVFKKVKTSIFGGAVFAFERLGPDNFIEDYKLLSLYNSTDTELIKKNLPVFCLEEVIGKRIRPRNSTSLLSHIKTQEYISKISGDKKVLILIYKSSYKLERLAKKKNWILAISQKKFGKSLLENKVKFREILEKIKVPVPPGEIVPLSFFYYKRLIDLEREYGLPFVLQHPTKGGGKGTFFIYNSKDFERAKQVLRREKPKRVIIAKYIKGASPSITGCVTRFGILSTRPQYQICDEPLLNKKPSRGGLFCGHDFSFAANFSKEILFQAKEIVDKVGRYFKKLGYKGIFGLDFVLEEKSQKLYVVECNPRLLATFPILTFVQLKNEEPPIIAFHLLEYLNFPYQINLKKINEQMWQKKQGSQMFFHSPWQKEVIFKEDFLAGTYQQKKGKIEFKKETWDPLEICSKSEYLFIDGLPQKGHILKRNQRIRIFTLKSVIAKDFKGVNKETRDFLKKTKNFIKSKIK